MARTLDIDALDFAAIVEAGDTVVWGQGGAEPLPLTKALMEQRHAIGEFKVFVGVSYSAATSIENTDCIAFSSYCGAGANRALSAAGKLDIVPCHYSQLALILSKQIDVLLLQLSPADSAGRYSLGIAHEYLVPLIEAARVVVAEINEQCPWTYGQRFVAASDLDYVISTSRPPLELPPPKADDVHHKIAAEAARWIEDGATVQTGLGILPELVLAQLNDRRDLGIHTGSIGDVVAELMRAGVVTNGRKTIDVGVSVAGVMLGGRTIYGFADRNPTIQLRCSTYTHGSDVLRNIDRFVAVNGAIEVDLTGQVNAEVANGVYVGAVGGAGDFLRAARCSEGGVPIIVLPSTVEADGKKKSRIRSRLAGPVSTPRSDAGVIVTEFGSADLRELSFAQRRDRMIGLAHPEFREALQREARALGA